MDWSTETLSPSNDGGSHGSSATAIPEANRESPPDPDQLLGVVRRVMAAPAVSDYKAPEAVTVGDLVSKAVQEVRAGAVEQAYSLLSGAYSVLSTVQRRQLPDAIRAETAFKGRSPFMRLATKLERMFAATDKEMKRRQELHISDKSLIQM